ncbi:MAG: hypothetical protein FJ272_12630, partial [Planctomycetes bacterium]|nr:hypothetical protein [Planctomycetota bacterium]
MPLTTNLWEYVDADVRERGRRYFQHGAVRIADGDEEFVQAVVTGTHEYEVELQREEGAVAASCTCPYYADNVRMCKHIWATLLACEARGLLTGDGRDPSLLQPGEDPAFERAHAEGEDMFDDRRAWPALFAQSSRGVQYPARPQKAKRTATWKHCLSTLRRALGEEAQQRPEPWPPGREILYVVDAQRTLLDGGRHGLAMELFQRDRKRNGRWSKPRPARPSFEQVSQLPDAADRQVLTALEGTDQYYNKWSYGDHAAMQGRHWIHRALGEWLLPAMCRTGRCYWRPDNVETELLPLQWDEGEPWDFRLKVSPGQWGGPYVITGYLQRGEQTMPLSEPHLLLADAWVLYEDRVARLRDFDSFPWISLLRDQASVSVPAKEAPTLLAELFNMPQSPPLDLPDELKVEQVSVAPRPQLRVRPPKEDDRMWLPYPEWLRGTLSFDYDGLIVSQERKSRAIYQAERRRVILRDAPAEQAAVELLIQVGFRENRQGREEEGELLLAPRNLPRAVRTLLQAGWRVEAEGKLYRQPGAFRIEVSSGIDWFELRGAVEFGDTVAKLPDLLAALKRGDTMVQLGDGSFGLLPEAWLKKYGLLVGLGNQQEDHLRFSKTQVGL